MRELPAFLQQAVERLLAFLAQDGCTDAQFDAMALELFALQYEHDEAYRRFCQRRGASPRRVQSWRDIPPVPISAFKDATLSCIPPPDCERIFMTSGTTRGDVKGRNHHPVMEVWDLSMRKHFEQRFLGAARRLPMATLFPSHEQLPNSSLARYLSNAVREYGTPGSRSFVDVQHGLDIAGLLDWLASAQAGGEPVAMLGASFSFVHVFDALGERRIPLPAGSLLLDTGGYKGQSRDVPLEDFYQRLSFAFGVPRERCINMYGMTELSSQFYDAGNAVVPSVKHAPHWVRTRVVDPLTGRDVARGKRGVLAHCDLANFNSATAILTEDVGVMVEGGGTPLTAPSPRGGEGDRERVVGEGDFHSAFLLLGRAEGAEAKGCSLAVQDFLEATRA
ncbi:long-chain fatty acid--CoA ligase [Ramlibacter algicola]|uniref:Long-chain fatty acid--CoA ligase n=1 Tax=Ramlibacter algicola TaxID=2795217 RepID=A0A934Q342_9BURK|nr:long-chain fatty acid--CoA ligase [Ramlibacter algicola]MBK0394111.1 long-chain fatty acid--CoA ligase [Ramlibacter algicola]